MDEPDLKTVTYRHVKNYLHNELGITRERAVEIMREQVLEWVTNHFAHHFKESRELKQTLHNAVAGYLVKEGKRVLEANLTDAARRVADAVGLPRDRVCRWEEIETRYDGEAKVHVGRCLHGVVSQGKVDARAATIEACALTLKHKRAREAIP